MLGKFPRYTFHVGRLPGEDVPILTEELDERAFYLGSRFVPMATVLEASPTTSSTGLVSMAALNAGAELEICFFDVGISESLT